jgi:hypothetical protein
MRLTRPTGPPSRGSGKGTSARSPTTEPGFVNPNRQVVERATGAPSSLRRGQTIYALRCRDCGYRYGCNGLDIKERCCPSCQGGVAGEAVQERAQASLFEPS